MNWVGLHQNKERRTQRPVQTATGFYRKNGQGVGIVQINMEGSQINMPRTGFITIEVGEDIKNALRLRSAKSGKTKARIVRDTLRKELQRELLKIENNSI